MKKKKQLAGMQAPSNRMLRLQAPNAQAPELQAKASRKRVHRIKPLHNRRKAQLSRVRFEHEPKSARRLTQQLRLSE